MSIRRPASLSIPWVCFVITSAMLLAAIFGYEASTLLNTAYSGDEDTSFISALTSVGQLVVLVFQALIFWRQSKLMTTQTELITTQTNELKTQTTLNQQNYIASHPPLIRVRPILTVSIPTDDYGALTVTVARIPIVNIGSTNANIIAFGVVMFEMDFDGSMKSRWIPEAKDYAITLKPRDTHEFYGTGSSGLVEYNIPPSYEGWLYVRGEIVYTDDRGTVRTTSFVRKYAPLFKSFLKLKKKDRLFDYEYEDEASA
jgi:hypothetical protein